MIGQLPNVPDNVFDQFRRCGGILQGNVVGDSVQVT
jgi:hypothetical protein